MSVTVSNWVWNNSDAGGSELLVLLALADYADDDGGNCYPSMNAIAEKARMSTDQTRRIIHKLIAENKIELVEKGGWDGKKNRANNYQILFKGTCNLQVPGIDARGGTCADASTVLATMQDQSSYNQDNTTNVVSDEPTLPVLTPPIESLANRFHALIDKLRDAKNKQAVLMEVYVLCYGNGDPPTYSYLGSVARELGGAGYLAQRMFELVARPPNGDVLAYILGEHRNKKNRANSYGNGKDSPTSNSSWSEIDSTVPDYMRQ